MRDQGPPRTAWRHGIRYGDLDRYMVGRTQDSAHPTVFFCSRDAAARQAVREEIDSSQIMRRYPGFQTGDCSRPPLDETEQLPDEVNEWNPQGRPTEQHLVFVAANAENSKYYRPEDIIFGSTTGPHPQLDYCVVEIPTEAPNILEPPPAGEQACTYHTHLPQDVSSASLHDGLVIAYTGSRKACHGDISGTPLFVTCPAGKQTQELWSVRLNGQLAERDCGSVVVNTDTKALEGHIIAGSPETGTALLIPAYQIMKDLRERFSSNIRLCEHLETCKSFAVKALSFQTAVAMGRSESSSNPSPAANAAETPPKTARPELHWAFATAERFRKIMSAKRIDQLKQGHRLPHASFPRLPRAPSDTRSLLFRNMLMTLSRTPCN
ncbi:hypothetical protein BST61_g5485 [Cercospora zeina]